MTQKKKFVIDGLLFSLTIAIFAVIYAMLIYIHDSDYNWHYIIGRDVVNGNANFYGTDTYSWIANERGFTEIKHSWLGGVLIYLCSAPFRYAPYGSLLFIFLTSFALTSAIHFLYGKSIACRPLFRLIYAGVIAYTVAISNVLARPRNTGYILFVLTLWLCQNKIKAPVKIVLLTVITTLWANLHGGSILLPILVIGAYAILHFIPSFEIGLFTHTQDKQEKKTLLIATAASFIGGAINPYHFKLYKYALFDNKDYMKQGLQEWRPTTLNSLSVLITLAALFVLFVLYKKKIDSKCFAAVLASFFMAMQYVRMTSFLLICAIPVVITVINLLDKTIPHSKKKKSVNSKKAVIFVMPVLLFSMIAECFAEAKKYDYYMPSDELISFIKDKGYERIYNGYTLGGYLIYNDIPCFVDARADLYPKDVLVPAKAFEGGFEGVRFSELGEAQEFLEEFNFDCIILNQNSSSITTDYLLGNGWEIVFEDTREEKTGVSMNYYVFEKTEAISSK